VTTNSDFEVVQTIQLARLIPPENIDGSCDLHEYPNRNPLTNVVLYPAHLIGPEPLPFQGVGGVALRFGY